ncbi:MAG: DNA recombination protein RmuC [Gammaproteobacteria bacterium]|nr:DNA recombination protein RmuC [Gammaproteobacteria bacterium]
MDIVLILIVAVLAMAAGAFVVHMRKHREIAELREKNTELKTLLDSEKRSAEEKLKAVEQARQQLSDTFAALSSQALKHNNEEFLKLAQENLKQFHIKSQGDLEQKEKAIEHLVKPIREALTKTEEQLQKMENERREAHGSLSKQLEGLTLTHQQLQGETRNLVQALRRPEVRGQWGEMTLKRLAELAGMVEHCDFDEQVHTKTEDGNLRPDMIVRMPDRRDIVVDVKTPLDAYLNAVEASDDAQRVEFLKHHAKKVRERVRELASKSYWNQFATSPDFVVLFIPGDQFLSSALEYDRDLLEDALKEKIILATPTSFVALLRAVAFGWKQESLAENAEVIRKLGEELYGRIATFGDYLGKVGSSLNKSVSHFNSAISSFESRVLPGARKFAELGISSKKDIKDAEQVDVIAKQITTTEDVDITH